MRRLTAPVLVAVLLLTACDMAASGIECERGCGDDELGLPPATGIEHPEQLEAVRLRAEGWSPAAVDEPAGEEPAVEEPAPEEPAPEEPAPEEPAPEEPAPEEPAPEEPAPEEPAPEDPAPEEPAPPTPPADCPQVRVVNTGGDSLNIRPSPSTEQAPVGALAAGEVVEVLERVQGQSINGVTTWYQIRIAGLTGYVSGAYAACVDPNAPSPAGFLLPFTCGRTVTVTQGNNSSFSHTGSSAWAFDFGVPVDTPVLACESGVVTSVRIVTRPGDACYDGGGSSCSGKANTVLVDHEDGTGTLYVHINSALVQVGQRVARGEAIARSGNTGYSTGPHLHLQRQQTCGSYWCQSVSMSFADVDGSGVPDTGDRVTSGNGC